MPSKVPLSRAPAPWLKLVALVFATLPFNFSSHVHAQTTFNLLEAPWRGFDTGTYPRIGPIAFATGDLNSDGNLDALVGRSFPGSPGILVIFGDGNGSFGPPTHYILPSQKSAGDVELFDFDGDLDLDAFATIPDANGLTNKFAVWRNNGNGTLGARVEYAAGPGPQGLVIGDFTGDGFGDVMTADMGYIAGSNSTISLMKHNGQVGAGAGFLAPISFPAGGERPQDLAAADLDGDDDLDVVVVRFGQPQAGDFECDIQHVLMNNGTGAFGPPTMYLPVPAPHRGGKAAVALADLDNDGDVDLIGGGSRDVGSINNGIISIRRNNGLGIFGNPELYLFDNFVSPPADLTTGDVNDDGFLDVVACSPDGRANDGWNLLLSNGSGGFLQPVKRHQASKETSMAKIVDLNEDGDQDVITLANDSALITFHENPGSGDFPVQVKYPIGVLSEFMDAGDIEGDGDLDIASTDDKVRILRNRGDGTFDPFQTYNSPINPADIKLRDLNGDGRPDLLLGPDAEFPPYHFATALNNGSGTFLAGVVHQVFSCGEGTIDALDLDNDLDLDVVLTEEQGCIGGAPPHIFLFRNDGNQVFTAMPPLFPPGFAVGIQGDDLNHDGNIDLITALGTGVGVYLGNGNMTFQPVLVSSSAPYRFALVDLNGDADRDVGILLPQDSFGTVSIGMALGNGDGTFDPAVQIPGATGLESAFRISSDIDAGDLSGDDQPDLIVTNNAPNDLSVFVSKGDGTANPQQHYGTGYSPRQSIVEDFTGDDIADVASMISLPPSGFASAVVVNRGAAGEPTGAPVLVEATSGAVRGFPNPTSGTVTFQITSPEFGASVRIFDSTGRRIRTLSPSTIGSGSQELSWDGRDEIGAPVQSGVYFYKAAFGKERHSGKIVVLK